MSKVVKLKSGGKFQNRTARYITDYLASFVRKPPKIKKEIDEFRELGNEFIFRGDSIENYRKELLDVYLENGIHEDECLHFYIRCFLGWTIPREARCKKAGHCAPFKFISDLFFERVRSAIVMANRTGGKTLSLAILNHLNMAFKTGCEVASAGAVRAQAGKMHEHFEKFHIRSSESGMGEMFNEIFIPKYKPITMTKAVYNNGSKIEIVTGTMTGLNSPHPQKAVFDEVELMSWDVINQGFSMCKSTPQIKSQNVFASTRKRADGTFERLMNMAKKTPWPEYILGYGIYSWCIWEVLEKCTRKCKGDPVYKDCPILPICKGRAKKLNGWYSIDDFILKYIGGMDKDVLESEWLCLKPARRALVYGDHWNRERNWLESYRDEEDNDGNITRIDLKAKRFSNRDIIYLAGIDFGGTKSSPFVFKLYAVDVTEFKKEVEEILETEIIKVKPTFYLIYEYRGVGTTEEHADKIKEHPRFSDIIAIFADPSAKQSRTDLEGLYSIDTYEANNDREAGIDIVKAHLWSPGGGANYFIFDDYLDCEDEDLIGTDMEFERYRHDLDMDGRPKRGVNAILKQDDHGMDVDRYVILTGIPFLRDMFTPLEETIRGDGYW